MEVIVSARRGRKCRGIQQDGRMAQAEKGTVVGNRWEIVGSCSLHSRVFQVTSQGYYSQAEIMSDTAISLGRH